MDALILSCSTSGGHNAAGNAVLEELQRRGHHAEIWDPYELVSRRFAERIGNTYIKTAQRMPVLFGLIYLLGEGYRRLPFRSPVYLANRKIAGLLEERLKEYPVDWIIMPHLFPAEVITYIKQHGIKVPKTVFISKPGGLSSTEAAALGTTLIHISPIPGCELANQRFFAMHHMCIPVGNIQKRLIPAVIYAGKWQVAEKMRQAQTRCVNRHACKEICDWLERFVQ